MLKDGEIVWLNSKSEKKWNVNKLTLPILKPKKDPKKRNRTDDRKCRKRNHSPDKRNRKDDRKCRKRNRTPDKRNRTDTRNGTPERKEYKREHMRRVRDNQNYHQQVKTLYEQPGQGQSSVAEQFVGRYP